LQPSVIGLAVEKHWYRGINDFKKGYHPRTNLVKDQKGDLVADPYNIVAGR